MAATHVRPEDINFMITHARGLVCLTITADRSEQLNLPLMSDKNGAKRAPTLQYRLKRQKGHHRYPAADRARTIQTAVSSTAKPKISYNRGMYSQLWHKMAVCYTVRVIPKPAVT